VCNRCIMCIIVVLFSNVFSTHSRLCHLFVGVERESIQGDELDEFVDALESHNFQ
jgi:hypothetical protein